MKDASPTCDARHALRGRHTHRESRRHHVTRASRDPPMVPGRTLLPPAMPGTLFVVAKPIGNLEDITLRALRVLRDVAVIAAEDTRRTAHLLARHAIATRTTSLHEHNEAAKSGALV